MRRGTEYFEALSKKIYSELARNPNQALKMAEKGIKDAKKNGSRIGLAKMILCRAHAYREIGEFKKSVDNYDLAYSAFLKSSEKVEAARTFIGKMDSLDQLGKYREALRIGKMARSAFRRADQPLLEARVNANTGNIHH